MTSDDRPSGIPDDDESDQAMPSIGTLVIRTWQEPDQVPTFRARVTYSQAAGGEPSILSTADPDNVVSLVRQWLSAQLGSPGEV